MPASRLRKCEIDPKARVLLSARTVILYLRGLRIRAFASGRLGQLGQIAILNRASGQALAIAPSKCNGLYGRMIQQAIDVPVDARGVVRPGE